MSVLFKIKLIDGKTVPINFDYAREHFLHRYSIATVIITFVILLSLAPYDYIKDLRPSCAFPYLFFSVVLATAIFWGTIYLSARVLKWEHSTTLKYSTFISLFMVFASDQALVFMGLPASPLTDLGLKVIFSALLLEIIFFFYFGFVFPRILEDTASDVVEPAVEIAEKTAEAVEQFDAFGIRFDINTIIRIKAEQSYVQIHTDKQEYLVRARFAECLELLPQGLGRQIHRSHWVRTEYASECIRISPNKTILRLTTGEELPVARGRTSEIENWVQKRQLGDSDAHNL